MSINLANIDIGGIATGVGTLARDLRAAITGKEVIDANKAAEIELKLLEIETTARTAQTRINEIEAASGNLFVAGWRPFAGWTCGLGFAYNYVLLPFMYFIISFFVETMPKLPELDMVALGTLLFGMLGMSGFRSWEKTKRVSREM